MPVKKKKASKPQRLKTATCTENDTYEVYVGVVSCPYCGETNNVEGHDSPPETDHCIACRKKFHIKWVDPFYAS